MATILSTRSSIQYATKQMERVFTNRAQKVPPLYAKFFNVIKTDPKRSFATFGSFTELGTLRNKYEGSAPTYDQPFENIPVTANYFTMALAAAITEEAQLEDPIGFMEKLPAMLADSEQVTKDLIFWNLLNLGYSPAVLLSDGQPLFSTAHPLAPRSTPTGIVSMIGQTQSNSLGAVQFTPDSLQQGLIMFETMISDRGLPRRMTPVSLICGPSMAKVAEEILGSPYQPGTNSNTINVIRETVQLMVVRFITSPTFWCLAAAPGDIEGDAHGLMVAHKWENRARSWMDPQTVNLNMATSFRSTYFAAKPWGLVGSQGA